MAIDLKGTDNPTDSDRKAFAFALGSLTTLRYLESDPDPKYQGYLVKVTSFDESEINIRGVKLSDGTLSATTRTIQFTDMKTIWLPGPSSSLSTWTATNCYIILFLSDDYTTGKQDLLDAKGTGGKWPKGSGLTILNLHEKVQRLEQTVDKLKPQLQSLLTKLSDKDKRQFTKAFGEFLR